MKQRSQKLILCIFMSFLVWSNGALAATLSFTAPPEALYIGDIFPVEIRINTSSETINAVRAGINFNYDTTVVESINKAGSILRFWPEDPSFSNTGGVMSLSGGLPDPGFNGVNGLIGTVYLKAVAAGKTSLYFDNTTRVLLNDGLGSDVLVQKKDAALSILTPPTRYTPKTIPPVVDNISPNKFKPIPSRSDRAFDGKYFIAFDAQDSQSGISYYEAKEIKDGKEGEWKRVTSPYVLENQEGEVRVLIKAVDVAGNETIETIEVKAAKINALIIYGAIIILAIILTIILWWLIKRLRINMPKKVMEFYDKQS